MSDICRRLDGIVTMHFSSLLKMLLLFFSLSLASSLHKLLRYFMLGGDIEAALPRELPRH